MARISKEIEDAKQKFLQTLVECKDKPSVFAKEILGYQPYWYNEEYLNCLEKWIVLRSGRKVGKTFTTGAKALHFAWFAPLLLDTVHKDCEIIIVSQFEDQAHIVLDTIRTFVYNSILKNYIVKDVAGSIQLRFITGGGVSKIFVKAAGHLGKGVRGYRPHVIIVDEASYVGKVVYQALLPAGIATNARIWLCGTPFTMDGYMYQACANSRAGSAVLKNTQWDKPQGRWKQFFATTLMNPEAKKNPDIVEEIAKMSKDAYTVDVLGEFLEVGNSLIPRDLIMQALGDYRLPQGCDYYLGVDVARTGKDETVYTLIAVDGNQDVYVIEQRTKSSTFMTEVVEDMKEYMKMYGDKIISIYCDEVGVGGGAVDMGIAAGLPVIGVMGSLQQKEVMYKSLSLLFEQYRVKFVGSGWEQLIYQLVSLHKEYTGAHMKVVSEEYDDRADSLAFACLPLEDSEKWGAMDTTGMEEIL